MQMNWRAMSLMEAELQLLEVEGQIFFGGGGRDFKINRPLPCGKWMKVSELMQKSEFCIISKYYYVNYIQPLTGKKGSLPPRIIIC